MNQILFRPYVNTLQILIAVLNTILVVQLSLKELNYLESDHINLKQIILTPKSGGRHHPNRKIDATQRERLQYILEVRRQYVFWRRTLRREAALEL